MTDEEYSERLIKDLKEEIQYRKNEGILTCPEYKEEYYQGFLDALEYVLKEII